MSIAIFVTIVLPWAMLSKVDETGTARGRLEPKGKSIKLDAAVAGTVVEIRVKEGDAVKSGQSLVLLTSDLVNAELRQAQDKLQGQLNQLSQLNLLRNQFFLSLATQVQQNKAQKLEKQTQIAQAQHNISTLINSYYLQKEEKLAQVNQARQTLVHYQNNKKLMEISLASSQREVERYQKAWQSGVVA